MTTNAYDWQPMRIYVSGGMTGWVDNNQWAFDDAAEHLTMRGHTVVTPVDLGRKSGEKLDGTGFEADDAEYEGFLERDLALITKDNLDAVVFVRGWQNSGGAGREGRKAIEEGLELFEWSHQWKVLQSLSYEQFLANSRTERLRPDETMPVDWSATT